MVNLRECRSLRGLTEATVAQQSGITQQYYSAIETGRRQPSVAVAKRLAGVLGIAWPMFFETDAVTPDGGTEDGEEGRT